MGTASSNKYGSRGRSCAVVRGRAWSVVHGRSCVVVRGSAWSCVVVHGRAWSCAVVRALSVVRGSAWSCVVMRGRAWSVVRARARSCAVVHAWSVIRGRARSVVRGRSCAVARSCGRARFAASTAVTRTNEGTNERTTSNNPLNPPGVGWVNFCYPIKVRVSMGTCVPNLGAIRRPVRKFCLSNL